MALCALAGSVENCGVMLECGGLKAVCTAMDGHVGSAEVSKAGCEAIRALSVTAENVGQVLSGGGAERVCIAMETQSEGVHIAGCMALRQLSCTPGSAARVVSLGGADHVVAVMEMPTANAKTMEAACRAFRSLSLGARAEKGVRDRLASAECLETLLGVMESHLSSAAVQEACLGALENLALNADKKVRGRMVSAGMVARVFSAMEIHTASADVQLVACCFLKNLTVSVDVAEGVLFSPSVTLVFAAMDAHLACLAVQVAACELCRVMLGPRFIVADEFAGAALKHIVASMSAHVGSAAVQEHGCCALVSLIESEYLRDNFVSSGALKAVHRALKSHVGSAPVQLRGLKLLQTLDCYGMTGPFLSGECDGMFEAVYRAMEVHPGSVSLQELACGYLTLSSDPEGYAQFDSRGLRRMDLVFMSMESHPSSSRIQTCGCLLIKLLVEHEGDTFLSPGNVRASRSLNLVLTAMRAHKAPYFVQLYACEALRLLALIADNHWQALMLSSGCVSLAYNAMRLYLEPALQVSALELLLALAKGATLQTLELLFEGLDQLYVVLDGNHAGAITCACKIMEALLANPEIAVRIFSTGAVLEHVTAAMEALPDDVTVQQAGRTVLDCIARSVEVQVRRASAMQ